MTITQIRITFNGTRRVIKEVIETDNIERTRAEIKAKYDATYVDFVYNEK